MRPFPGETRSAPFARAPVGLGVCDLDLRYVEVNEALAAINGVPAAAHPGRRPSELLGRLGAKIEADHRAVLETRRPLEAEVSGRTPADPATDRHWLVTYYPVENGGGQLESIGAVVVDVTDRHRAEAEGERLRRRAEFLARSAGVLASSLDVDATIQSVVEAAVPELGDWAACTLVSAGELHMAACAHADPTDPRHEEALGAVWPQPADGDGLLGGALRTGEAALLEVGEEHLDAAARSPEHRAALRAMDVRTVLVAPLVVPTGVLGALVLLRAGGGPGHTPDDLGTAQALADRAAVAIAHARAHDEAQRRLALLDTLYESAPVGIAFLDAGLRYRRVNGQLAQMNGAAAEAHVGRTPAEILGRMGDPVTTTLRRVLRDGATAGGEIEAGGRHFLTNFAPVDVAGERIGVTGVVIDVTDRRASERRERLLGRVAEAMDAELDPARSAHRLCELVVGELGCAALVRVRDEEGLQRTLASAHAGEEGRALLDRFLTAGERLPQAVHASLVARGRSIGDLTLLRPAGAAPFGPGDHRFLADLGRRAALTLDNLQLYAAHKAIASTLQSRLLPQHVPRIDGLEIATSYRAAGRHNDVGGDFFDVFDVPEGWWTALVGDVAGKGAAAAALTASIRQIMRTASRWTEDAGEMLALVNDELLHEEGGPTCTLAHTSLHDGPEGLRVAVTLAGHPQPLVLRRDGTVESVGRPGTLLGGLPVLELETDVVVLGPGDLLLLYTDGAVETGRGQPGAPLLDLERVLAGCAGDDAAEVVRCVEAAAVRAAGGTAPDDIALVCLRRPPGY